MRKKHRKPEQVLQNLSIVVPAVMDSEENVSLHRLVDGVPVLVCTLQALNALPMVHEIIIVTREAELLRIAELCRNLELERVKHIIVCETPGFAALELGTYACDCDVEYIGVHDSLWPFVTRAVVERAIKIAAIHGAAAPAVQVKDTIKIVEGNIIKETPNRSTLYAVQMPQIVQSSLLKAAIETARDKHPPAGDLQSVLETLGLPLGLSEGCDENIPVRHALDVPAAQGILTWRAYR